jgi:hypothetical protein
VILPAGAASAERSQHRPPASLAYPVSTVLVRGRYATATQALNGWHLILLQRLR